MFAASHKFHFYEFVEKVIFNASVLLALRSSVRFCDTVIMRIVMAGWGGGGGRMVGMARGTFLVAAVREN